MENTLAEASAFTEVPEAAAFLNPVEPECISTLHPGRVVMYE